LGGESGDAGRTEERDEDAAIGRAWFGMNGWRKRYHIG
jgi:hypothetical protein